MSLGAAGNGERAEEAAVANGVAILAMPSVSEAIDARIANDVMASLAAYNGAILNGRFEELDEALSTQQVTASAVMYQYEETCAALATPWDQPLPPDACGGAALESARGVRDAGDDSGAEGSGAVASAAGAPAPLTAFQAKVVKTTASPPGCIRAVRAATRRLPLDPGWVGGTARWPLWHGVSTVALMNRLLWREHSTAVVSPLLGLGLAGHGCSRLSRTAHRLWCRESAEDRTPLYSMNWSRISLIRRSSPASQSGWSSKFLSGGCHHRSLVSIRG
jgi:hypothetical protein